LSIHPLSSNEFTIGNGNVFQEVTGQGENLVCPCQLLTWMEAAFKLKTLAVTETKDLVTGLGTDNDVCPKPINIHY
jgi:hypothetical protein